MNKKVNISAIKHKMHFIYKDEREKNIAAIVIYNKDGKFFFDPEYKNEMSNLEVEALLLRGALVDRGGKYYRPSSFNDNNVSFSDAVINPEDIEVDLSGYVTKDEMEDAMADIDLSDYVTDAELTSKNYATKDYVDKKAFNGGSNATVVDNVEPAENDMPRLFLYDGVLPTTKDSVVMAFEYISKNKRFQGYVDIKCQGTSSMGYDKKNFTIKLFSDETLENKIKINFMNWGEQNKFCLKANWVDSTHTRNIVGARIGYDIVQSRPDSEFKRNLLTAPRYGLIDGFPIKLYYKGEFYGIYTWNIPKDAWQFAMDEDNENHIVLCAEKNSAGNTNTVTSCQFKTLWTNGDKGDWSVEVGTYSNSLVEKWNRVISFVKDSSDEEFINNFEQYFDLYSVIDYYCFSYFMTHIDGLGKNMLVATYDGNIWGCSLYDMDTTVGAYWNSSKYVPYNYRCPEDYEEPFSLLWERIEKCFTQILCERYFALREKGLSLANIINHIERLYDVIPDRVFNDEKIKWANIPQVSTNTMTRVRKYLKDRAEYVDKQFNKLMNGEDEPDVPVLPKDDAIYTLAETQVLDGSSKYIDTGIALLEKDIDYTIFVDFSMNTWQGKQKSLLHCMNEVTPYPGINLQTDNNGFLLSGSNISGEISVSTTGSILIPDDVGVRHSVFIRREGDTLTMITKEGTASSSYTHNSVSQNLLIGAYQTTTGELGRHLNCTVYQTKVWNRALSDDEVNKLMNGEDEPDVPEEPVLPEDGAIYTLSETQVLDGSSKYIDTGIALLEDDIDYTIFMVYSMNASLTSKSCLLHCMTEDDPYPGISIQSGANMFELSGANASSDIGLSSDGKQLLPIEAGVRHSVFIRREGDTLTMTTDVGMGSSSYAHKSTDKHLLIGAYQTTTGEIGRYTNCTVYQVKVWNRALSDDEISSYINGN